MTVRDIERAIIGRWSFNLWVPQSVYAVTRSVGIVGHEADLLILQRETKWLYEVEIKTSVADFRKEFKTESKAHRHRVNAARIGRKQDPRYLVRKLFFAMPRKVYEKVMKDIPDYAGIIVVDPYTATIHRPTQADYNNCIEVETFKAYKVRDAKILEANRADDEIKAKMLESVHYAFWRRGE